jgi:hypothetical protein
MLVEYKIDQTNRSGFLVHKCELIRIDYIEEKCKYFVSNNVDVSALIGNGRADLDGVFSA